MSKIRRQPLRLVSARTEPAPQATKGKVVHDERGNAVWDWAIETDVLTRTSATGLLRALSDHQSLALEADADKPASWSGDPYNRSSR
jgi:hypothetical protein